MAKLRKVAITRGPFLRRIFILSQIPHPVGAVLDGPLGQLSRAGLLRAQAGEAVEHVEFGCRPGGRCAHGSVGRAGPRRENPNGRSECLRAGSCGSPGGHVLYRTGCMQGDLRGEILEMGVGQDEKAVVVGDELKALILQEWGPADKTVWRPALEGRRRPAKQGKPLSGAARPHRAATPPPGARSPGSDAGASALPSAPPGESAER